MVLELQTCRCVLEMAAPVWSAGITVAESRQIERVQKAAFSIILGKQYVSYEQALIDLNMETLQERRIRERLFYTFLPLSLKLGTGERS